MDSDDCTPVAADVILQKLFAGGITDICALCACNTSLLRIDNTNYVHLNDVYNDRRLTLTQLVKKMQFDQYISKSSPQLICESCVRSMCRFQLYKNKCRKVTSGLKTLVHMVDNDLLEKLLNVNTGEIATILPYKNVYEFSDIDSGISTDDPEIIGFESIEEVEQVENSGKELIVKDSGGYYVCALCPNVKLRANDLVQHRLSHYYKNVTHNLVLRNAFCFCCLVENAEMIDAKSNMVGIESEKMVPLSEIMSALFGYVNIKSLGRIEVCEKCFDKILNLYNFKITSEASTAIVQDCVSSLEACLQSPKSALTITEENEHRNICLLDMYSAFVELSVDRIRTVAPLLNHMKVYDEETKQKSIKQAVKPSTKKAKNKYMCTICGIASETLARARDHRLDHCTPRNPNGIVTGNSEPSVACHICGGEFVKPLDLHSHVTSKHNDLTFCPFCDKAYKGSREMSLKSHMKMCEQVYKPMTCDLCSASFVNRVKLSLHRVRHFPRDVKCDFCAMKFWTIRELKRHHCKVHRELLGLQFECSMCPMEFGTKTERIDHMATHPPGSRHVCKFCSTTFRLKTNYVAHKCVGKILDLRNHARLLKCLKVKHEGGFIEESMESDCDRDNVGMDSMCDLCGKMFKTERYLKAHRRTHLGKAGSDRIKLKRHGNEGHCPIKSTLVCDQCDYKTSYKNCLEAHINRHHLQMKPYPCEFCTKKFYSKVNRTQHLKTHAEGMPCDTCGHKFSSRKALRLHIRLHTGVRPYPCDLCDEKFISASRRQDHRIRKHFDPSVPCLDCMNYFYTQREYRMHVRDFHEGEKKRRLKMKKQAQETNLIISNEQ